MLGIETYSWIKCHLAICDGTLQKEEKPPTLRKPICWQRLEQVLTNGLCFGFYQLLEELCLPEHVIVCCWHISAWNYNSSESKKEVQNWLCWQDTSNSHRLKFLPTSAKRTDPLTTPTPISLKLLASPFLQSPNHLFYFCRVIWTQLVSYLCDTKDYSHSVKKRIPSIKHYKNKAGCVNINVLFYWQTEWKAWKTSPLRKTNIFLKTLQWFFQDKFSVWCMSIVWWLTAIQGKANEKKKKSFF